MSNLDFRFSIPKDLCRAVPADEHSLCQVVCGAVPSAVSELVKTSQNW